jgi:TatD DNase family protein
MIDSHCHPQFPQYDDDREDAIKRALDENIQMICVGMDLGDSKKVIGLAEKHEGLLATVGFHPNDRTYGPEFEIYEYEKLLDNKKVIAIGEVGLDYYRIVNPKEKQKEIFKQFIELAIKNDLPLVVHSRDAFDDLYLILKPYFINHKSNENGVIHSFTGSWSDAQKFLDLGFYIGLNGIITFSKNYAEMVKNLPLDKILIETDAPFLAPTPNRGKRNEPLFVKYVAEKIAEIKGIYIDKVACTSTENTIKLFRLNGYI